jgi:hypothetical protein
MFKTQEELEAFIRQLTDVIPGHENFPQVLTIPGLKALKWSDFRNTGKDTVGFISARGTIKLVDKELYSLEEKYLDRISRLERLLAEKK